MTEVIVSEIKRRKFFRILFIRRQGQATSRRVKEMFRICPNDLMKITVKGFFGDTKLGCHVAEFDAHVSMMQMDRSIDAL